MATLTQILSRVRLMLRDSESAFVTDAQITEWANEAQLDLNARLGILRKAATGTTSATGTVASMPSDFISLESFVVRDPLDNTKEVNPEFTSDDIFYSYKNSDTIPGNTLARIFNGVLETYPAVVSAPYTLEYVFKPVALAAGGDISALPEELHIRLINYARAHAKWMESETTEGNTYMALYEAGLPAMAPNAIFRERNQPKGFLPDPSYWDEDV